MLAFFVAANRRFCDGLGCAEAELRGKDDFAFFPPELARKYQADDRLVLAEGKRLETEEDSLVEGRRWARPLEIDRFAAC